LIQHDDLPASFRSGLHGGDPHEAGARFADILLDGIAQAAGSDAPLAVALR
jgi:hypothetical protein